jgi:predicted chitinase
VNDEGLRTGRNNMYQFRRQWPEYITAKKYNLWERAPGNGNIKKSTKPRKKGNRTKEEETGKKEREKGALRITGRYTLRRPAGGSGVHCA